MKHSINLYRKRYIPDEIIHLKDDEILHISNDLIITKWQTLKPRSDIARGISAYYMDKGFKVSKIYDKNNNIVYWYCDIIHTNKNISNNSIIFEDLLIDVIIYEDKTVKVVDMDEIATALEQDLLPITTICEAMRTLNELLLIIYNDDFNTLSSILETYE